LPHLTRELDTPELSHISATLQRGLRTTQIEATRVQDELTRYNDTRFALLQDYLGAESDNTAHLHGIVDLLTREHEGEPRQLIADISDTSSRATRLLARYDAFQ
jgi:hypothetical protein